MKTSNEKWAWSVDRLLLSAGEKSSPSIHHHQRELQRIKFGGNQSHFTFNYVRTPEEYGKTTHGYKNECGTVHICDRQAGKYGVNVSELIFVYTTLNNLLIMFKFILLRLILKINGLEWEVLAAITVAVFRLCLG